MSDEPATVMALLQRTAHYLQERGIDNARREAEWLFADTLGLSRLDLYTRYDMPLDPEQVQQLRQRVTRRGRREPLAYILGTQPFCGLELAVDAHVLVPRPETEELVELILQELPQEARVLDVGTGSGAIALALAAARPQADVHATDASAEALRVARVNGERCGLEVGWHHGHLHEPAPALSWDLVVANLPYVAEEERALCDPETAFEPAAALFAPDAGLSLIRELISAAPQLLTGDGVLWLEHGFTQGPAIAQAATVAGLQSHMVRDGAGLERFTRVAR